MARSKGRTGRPWRRVRAQIGGRGVNRPCLQCGTPTMTTRCPACARAHDRARGTTAQRGYGTDWRKTSEQVRKQWIAAHGYVCPGWQRPSHTARDLVVDHDVGVLCRSCNAVKAATIDKQRARGV